jgi:hypothetical protein
MSKRPRTAGTGQKGGATPASASASAGAKVGAAAKAAGGLSEYDPPPGPLTDEELEAWASQSVYHKYRIPHAVTHIYGRDDLTDGQLLTLNAQRAEQQLEELELGVGGPL